VTEPAHARLHGACVALLAVLRRDLVASRRGARTYLVRLVAMAASGIAALAAWHAFATRVESRALGSDALHGIVVTIVLLGFLQAIVTCVSALRAERQAGLLDLVFLAGVSPRVLVLARTISTWLALEAMIVACLPALGLLWLFRAMTPEDLVVAVGALSLFNLAVSAASVAVSAWAPSAGMALAMGALLSLSWLALTVAGSPLQWDATLLRILEAVTSPDPVAQLPEMLVVFGVAHVMLVVVGLSAARLGVERRSEATRPDMLLKRIERRPLPVGATRPMTWLARRLSAPARPMVQAPIVAIVVVLALVELGREPERSGLMGMFLALTGLFVAAAIAATSIAPARERGQWMPLAATGLDGRSLLGDLAWSAASSTFLPVIVGTLLIGIVLALAPGGIVTLPMLAIGVLASWGFAIVAGLVASLASRTSAAALALTGAILVGEPLLGLVGWNAWREASRQPLGDRAGALGWLLLMLDALILGTWLVLRAGFARPSWRLPVAFAPATATLALPLVLGDTLSSAAWAGALLGVGSFGLVLWPLGARRADATMMLVGILLVASFILTPAFLLASDGDGDTMFATVGGGFALFACFNGIDGPPGADLMLASAAGALHQLALASLLILAFRPRLERWLGRAG